MGDKSGDYERHTVKAEVQGTSHKVLNEDVKILYVGAVLAALDAKLVKQISDKFDTYFSAIYKTNITVDIQSSAIASRSDQVLTAFVAKSMTTGDSFIYAILTTYRGADKISSSGLRSAPKPVSIEDAQMSALKRLSAGHTTVCLAPSYMSCDGEYRKNIIHVDKFKFVAEKYAVMWDKIRQLAVEHIDGQDLLLINTKFAIGDEESRSSQLLDYSIRQENLALNFFAAIYYIVLYETFYDILPNHINRKFIKAMTFDRKEMTAQFQSLMAIGPCEIVYRMFTSDVGSILKTTTRSGEISYTMPSMLYMTIGQKIIPMNIAEVQNPFNLKYKPWKELLITRRLGDLVVNNISYGFPVIASWNYIRDVKQGLFDNEIQYDKIEKSIVTKQILLMLRNAQKLSYSGKLQSAQGDSDEFTDESWLSNKFRELNKRIQGAIDYGKNEIVMSDVALCIVSEYVGNTIMDSVLRSNVSESFAARIGNPYSADGHDQFAKYMFDICYNLLCMNHYFGVIHMDLHLNNATLNQCTMSADEVCARFNLDAKLIKRRYHLYVLGNGTTSQTYKYALPYTGYVGTIIDFSRSVVEVSKIGLFRLPGTAAIEYSKRGVYETGHMINTYLSMFPDMGPRRDMLLVTAKSKYKAFFKLMTAIDVYKFANNMMILFGMKNKKLPSCSARSIELLRRLVKHAEYFLTTCISKLIDEHEYERVVRAMDHPVELIIKSAFSEYQVVDDLPDIAEVSAMRELKYSIDSADSLPEYLRYLPSKDKKELTLKETVAIVRYDRLRAADETRLKAVGDIIKYAQEVIQYDVDADSPSQSPSDGSRQPPSDGSRQPPSDGSRQPPSDGSRQSSSDGSQVSEFAD